MSKKCRNESCDEKDKKEPLKEEDDFTKIEKEVNKLIKVASDGYIEIDYEIEKTITKLQMLLDFVLSIYTLNEEERELFLKLTNLLNKANRI